MNHYVWLKEEIDKARKTRNLYEPIKFDDLFTESFMSTYTGLSSIKDLLMAAESSGYLNNGINKEDLDKYLSLDLKGGGFFFSWDEMLNESIDQYIWDKKQ